MKIACIILTNNNTKEIYEKNDSMLRKMSIESKYDVDVFTYYNDESIQYKKEDNIIYFSYEYLKNEFNYNHIFWNKYAGLVELTLFDFYIKNKEYDVYMFYEDDMWYNSDKNIFDNIFDNFEYNSYDIIFQDERIYDKNWTIYKYRKFNCYFKPYKGLLNLYVIKPNLINDLINFIKEGNYGHHEYLINGFALTKGYKIKYLTDVYSIYSSFLNPIKIDKEYEIYHPVKKLKDIEYIKNNIFDVNPFKTCIMTMAKNERLYIKEWADYHLNLGFDDIFIFEDSDSELHDDIFEDYDNVHIYKLTDKDKKSLITTCSIQIELMRKFLKKLKKEHKYDWCLFTDVDEFLVLEDGYNLLQLCFEYQDYPGLLLSWKIYSANGHIKRPEGNVIDNYSEPVDIMIDGNKFVTEWNKKSFVNIHRAKDFVTNHCIKDGVDIELSNDINNKIIYKKAWINHYFTKSWEDFCYRMETRGNMRNDNRSYDQFFILNKDLIPLKQKLIFLQRYKHNNNIQYISREYKLISGGNILDILELNKTKNYE